MTEVKRSVNMDELKPVSRKTLDAEKLTALDFSVSTFFNTGFRSLRFGMTFDNLGKDITLIDETWHTPVAFAVGGAVEMFGQRDDQTYLTVTFENYFATDNADVQYRLGGELWLQKSFALRGGYKFKFDEQSWTLGAGLKFTVADGRVVQADIAYSDFGEYLDSPLRFTLSGAF